MENKASDEPRGNESAMNETQTQLVGPGYCHFTPMEYSAGESDYMGGYDDWMECKHCGHTEDVPREALSNEVEGF